VSLVTGTLTMAPTKVRSCWGVLLPSFPSLSGRAGCWWSWWMEGRISLELFLGKLPSRQRGPSQGLQDSLRDRSHFPFRASNLEQKLHRSSNWMRQEVRSNCQELGASSA